VGVKASPCAWSGPKDTGDFVRHCREQAGWCAELGSPFTAALCEAFAADAEAGGVVAQLAETVPPPHRKRATSLRLAGALHYGVLSGRAPELAKAYPKPGARWDIQSIWKAAAEYLKSDIEHIKRFIASDPQTNETRRTIALLPGFLKIAESFNQPLHLLELGASAGLNQNLAAFNYSAGDWVREGQSDVHISTAWRAPALSRDVPLEVASRAACDLNPIDLSTQEARWRLKAYTWADQPERLTRLDAAMALALETGVQVEQADAADWIERKLAERPKTGTTVVFHSVFLHYPPGEVRARIRGAIEMAGAQASMDAPLAWLCMEPDSVFAEDNPKLGVFQVRLQTWPGGEVQVLGYTDGHVTYFEAA
jgi:hypothetical protein